MQASGVKGRRRRSYSAQFKAQVVQQCRVESVSAVALGHGINPVTVHRWIREEWAQRAGEANPARSQPERFVPVAVPHAGSALMMSPPQAMRPSGVLSPWEQATPLAQAPLAREHQPEHQPEHTGQHLQMEFALAGQVVRVSWPVSAAGQAAVWLRELLR